MADQRGIQIDYGGGEREMSGDPELDKKMTELPKLSIWSRTRLLVSKPCPDYLLSVKSPELRQKLEDEEVKKEMDENYQAFFPEIFGIQSKMHVKCGSYFTPFLKLTDYEAKARSMFLFELRSQIELAQVEIELIDETIAMLNSGITESMKNYFLSHNEVDVTYRRGSLIWGQLLQGLTAWERHECETLEKIEVLKVGKIWFQKFIEIYKQAITQRESQKKETLERIKRAQKVVADAEKTIEKIQKAERACQDSNYTDAKAIKEFTVSWKCLDELRTKFSTLSGSSVEFQDFGHPEPIFPSTAGLIATETDAARKGKIFSIFEKSQREK